MRANEAIRELTKRRPFVRALTLGCALAFTTSVGSAQLPASTSRVTPVPSPSSDLPISRPPDFLSSSRHPDILMSEGHDLYDAGRYKEAAASFERAMQLGVARPHEAARNVARSYAKLGNRKQAVRWAEIAELLEHPERAPRPLRSRLLLKI
jgi:tetratricopeptide (TPR) repeat protein